jgi:hypothetical protein
VGENLVPYLELHGAVIKELETPLLVKWLDDEVVREVTKTVELSVMVAATDLKYKLTFYVVPWSLDMIVLGWQAIVANKLLAQLDDLMQVQKNMNVCSGSAIEDDNKSLTDMDGRRVSVDEYLWVDEEPADSSRDPPTTVLTVEEQVEVVRLLDQFQDVFDEKPAGSALVPPMVISVKPGWKRPPMDAYRKYAPRVEAAIEMDLQKQLDKGVVIPSDASYGCAVHAVPKADSESGFRFTIDYKPINGGVETEPYPLPKIQDILSSLAGARYFAKLDLRSGYWQFPLDPASRDFLAFVVRGQMYTYRVVPMGFVDSSFFVQRTMTHLFRKVNGRNVFIYLDDIIVHAKEFTAFLVLLQEVLGILRYAQLSCKRENCAFGLEELVILGHVVSRDVT